jgi:Tol biopolymer transport system component
MIVAGHSPGGALRSLRAEACAQVRIVDIHSGEDMLVFQADHMLEAPNWTPDGKALCVNGMGRIALLPLAGETGLEWVDIEGMVTANNDHLIAPDGQTLFLSAEGGVYAVAIGGGKPVRLTPPGSLRYYLHGISPDGATLACTTIDYGDTENGCGIRLVPATGGAGTVLLSGTVPLDGPEWTPDGEWIWFNGEIGARVAGHAQLFRIRPDGSGLERMTDSDTVDWFPHLSPDGEHVAFISFPPGTQGHPPDVAVQIRLMDARGGAARTLASLSGGQGTINVNSWSPDSRRLAYVAYPDFRGL